MQRDPWQALDLGLMQDRMLAHIVVCKRDGSVVEAEPPTNGPSEVSSLYELLSECSPLFIQYWRIRMLQIRCALVAPWVPVYIFVIKTKFENELKSLRTLQTKGNISDNGITGLNLENPIHLFPYFVKETYQMTCRGRRRKPHPVAM